MTIPGTPVPGPTDFGAGRSTVLRNISQLVTNDGNYGPGLLGTVEDAAIVLQHGEIAWVGPDASAPAADEAVDVGGRAVLPGWVDSHTHLIFAGDRAAEFTARMAGEKYAAAGILSTVAATRGAARDDLERLVAGRLGEMLAGGTTCVETKTGYGLRIPDEVQAAELARRLDVDAVTFLGAHVVPPEYESAVDSYVDLVCGPMLDAIAPEVQFVDVFCEEGAFDDARSRRILAAGLRKGLALKVHGNQLGYGSGPRLAADLGAVSVDHCTYLDDRDVEALASSSTVATLLPACDLSTKQPPAPARRLLDARVSVALASNCNPGSSYTSSMSLVVALAVMLCGMTPAEAVYAATAGGARALARTDVGRLTPGTRADLHVLDAPSYDHIAYRIGMPLTFAVWRKGVRAV